MPASPLLKILDSVDSTNNYAMASIHAGMASHGMAWFAHEQTHGKGQRGRNWDTARRQNIAISIIIDPLGLNTSHQFALSMAVAEACYSFFSAYSGPGCSIKWPNDLYFNDRKAAGILIENIFQGPDWKWAIVGIGVNINQVHFNAQLKNPVSLKQITGKIYDTEALAAELHRQVLHRSDDIRNNRNDALLEQYNTHLYKRGEKVRLRKGNMVFETTITGVNALGCLLTYDSIERQFDFGEVEWIL